MRSTFLGVSAILALASGVNGRRRLRLAGSLGAALLLIVSSARNGEAQTVCATWTELSANQTPFARANHATVYDSARDRMLLFGGNNTNGLPLDEVWAFSLTGTPALTQVATQGAGGVVGAVGASAIYDPLRDRLIVFGGTDPNGTAASGPGTTYQLDLSVNPATWSVLSVSGTAPPNRADHTAIYDASRDRMLVFGGSAIGGGSLNDVWALSLSGTPTWTQLTPSGSPPAPRFHHVAIYDAPRDQMIVYGGQDENQTVFDDVIALSLSGSGSWSALGPSGTPPTGRTGATAIADTPRDRMLVFSGLDADLTPLNETWSLSLAGSPAWTRLLPTGVLPLRPDDFASIYDPVRQRMVCSLGDEFWSLSNLSGTPAWSELVVPGAMPLPRQGATLVYDPARQNLVLFGGATPYGFARDLWTYVVGTGVWSRIAPTSPWPTPREFAAAIHDPLGDRMMLFGGKALINNTEILQNDTWQLSLAGPTWARLTPSGTRPGMRSGPSAILDTPRNRMIVYGGTNSNDFPLNDVWSLSLAGGTSWSQLSPTGGPALTLPVSVFDTPRDRMVTFGDGQVWALGLAGPPSWSQISPTGAAPSFSVGPAGAYDPAHERLIVSMGTGSSASFALDLSGTPRWNTVNTPNNPAPRGYASAAWDAGNDRMLLVAGGGTLNDVQALSFPSSLSPLNLTVSPSAGGTVQLDPAASCYPTNTQVTLTAVPVAGYAFAGWSGDVTDTQNPLTITMDDAKNITASFVSTTTYPLTTTAVPSAGGTITRNPNQSGFAPGSQVTLTATPSSAYGFLYWTGDASGATNPIIVTMSGPKTINAIFATYALTTTASPAAGGMITRDPDQSSYAPGSIVTLTAIPNPGYSFLYWTTGGGSSTTNPLTVIMSQSTTITAVFALVTYTLSTQASPVGSGTVQRSPDAPSYAPGTQVTLTANGAGFPFTGWTGDLVGSQNPAVIVMDGNKNITATFQAYVLTTNVTPGGSGTITRNPDQGLYPPGPVTLTATPVNGFAFTGWSGDATGTTNPLTLNMDAHKSVTANFATPPPACGDWTVATNVSQSRGGSGAAWDPVNHRVLRFGGHDGLNPYRYFNDLWSYTLAGGWTQLSPAGVLPSPRDAPGFLYDPVRGRMLLVYGSAEGFRNDVWQLSLSGTPTWSAVTTSGTAPTGRAAFSTIYDPIRDRVILFGGGPLTNEVWALSLAGTPTWTQLAPAGTPPSPRFSHVAIYDPVRDRMLVYGGITSSSSLSDTWELSLSGTPTWTQLAPLGTDPQVWSAASAYDPIRDRMLVVSGAGDWTGTIWSLSLKYQPAWFRIPAGGALFTARYSHCAVYEPDDDLLLSFNGVNYPNGTYLTDTQRLDCAGGYWLETAADHGSVNESPQKACYANGAAVALTAVPSYVFQNWFGDATGSTQPLNLTMDTNKVILAHFEGFTLNVSISPAGSGTVTQNPNQSAYAPGSQVTLTAMPAEGYVFVGWSGDATDMVNPLTLNMDANKTVTANFSIPAPECGNWTLVTNDSQSRASPGAAWDPLNQQVLRFGGAEWNYDAVIYRNDLWSYINDFGWSQLSTAGSPPTGRDAPGFLYDPVRHRMLLIGGRGPSGPIHDGLWQLSSLLRTPTWSQVATAGTQPPLGYAFSTIYDPIRDRVILFGGYLTNDVWELALAGTPTWTKLTPSGTPPSPRYEHVAIYDPVRDRMLVHGGLGNSGVLGDTWALSLSGPPTWMPIIPFGEAPFVASSSAVYDPIRDRMLVISGSGPGTLGNTNAVWSLSLKAQPSWFRIPTGGISLGSRAEHAAVYDPDDDLILAFNGLAAGYTALTDTKRLDCAGGYWLETGGDHGTVSQTPLKACYGGGETVSLVPTGQTDYAFQNWLGDVTGNTQPLDVTMDANKVILGQFYTGSVGVGDPPLEFALEEIRPNPNPGPVDVSYSLPRSARVKLAIYDLAGREVCLLASGTVAAGRHSARWNGLANGSAAKSGIYFVRYETPVHTWSKRLVLLR